MDDVGTHFNWLTQLKSVHLRLKYTAGNSSDGDLTSKMIKKVKMRLKTRHLVFLSNICLLFTSVSRIFFCSSN